jgi:hypothetical protein
MTPEEKHLLEQTHKLAEENNEILRTMRRYNRVSAAFRIFYWVIIIGISIGAFYFIQPYIDGILGVYKGIGESVDKIRSIGSSL